MSQDEKERERREEKESALRDRIFEEPSLLPGFDEPLAAAKEVPVRRAGSADVMVVDAEGEIAIVECKRASNSESRREVIGQVFEYAAGLWKLDYENFKRLFRAARGTTLTKRFESIDGWKEETFGRAISQKLQDGDFRIFIAVDEMTEQLKKKLNRTVTLLNSQLPNVQFLAVAVPGSGPAERYGDDPDAISALPPKLKRWTLIEQFDSEDAQIVAEDLFEWADDKKSREVEVRITPIRGIVRMPAGQLFRMKPPGKVKVSLSDVNSKAEPTRQLVQELGEIGFRVESEDPEAPLELLADDPTRARFLELMERHLETLTGG